MGNRLEIDLFLEAPALRTQRLTGGSFPPIQATLITLDISQGRQPPPPPIQPIEEDMDYQFRDTNVLY